MTDEELMYALQGMSNDLRKWEAAKLRVDMEYPVDDRPATEAWNTEWRSVFHQRIQLENLLIHYRTMVALRIRRRVSSWTPDEMITLIGERHAKC